MFAIPPCLEFTACLEYKRRECISLGEENPHVQGGLVALKSSNVKLQLVVVFRMVGAIILE